MLQLNNNETSCIKKNKPYPLKKDKKVDNTYMIEFPFYGVKSYINSEGLEDLKYYNGKESYKWFNQEFINGINWSWNGSNMIDYIDNNDYSVSFLKNIDDWYIKYIDKDLFDNL